MKYIQTEKFTDTSITIRSILPLKKETITALNVLIFMLRSRTEKYDTKEKFARALNEAYAFKVIYGLTGYGRYVGFDIRFQYIRPDFIDEPGYTEQILDLMKEVVERPLLNEKTFEEGKYLLAQRLKRNRDDPESLAFLRALEIVQPGHSISIPVQGSLEDVEKLTFDDVKKVYDELRLSKKMTAACGILDENIKSWLESLNEGDSWNLEKDLIQDHEVQVIDMEKRISQSALVQIWADHTDVEDPLYYPLLVANTILGQGPMSLLFEEVREHHSLCYSISSMLLRFDGAMLIFCSCREKDMDQARALIKEQVRRLQDGDFDDSRIEIAKMDLVDTLNTQADRPFGLMEQYFFDRLLSRSSQDAETRKEKILSVTRKQVIEAARRLKLLTESMVSEAAEQVEVME